MEGPSNYFSKDVKKYSDRRGDFWEDTVRYPEDYLDLFKIYKVDLKSSKILEVGSGNSHLVSDLKKHGINIFGVDVRLRGGGKKEAKSQLVTARVEQLPFPSETFEVVMSNGVFDDQVYNQNQKLMVEEIIRVLKPGGYCFMAEPNLPLITDGLQKIDRGVYKKI